MHLVVHATVKCQTVLELPPGKLFQQKFPTWKRFIGAIEQYADREIQVTIPFHIYLIF